MNSILKAFTADLLTASIGLVLVWGAFSLLDVHDSVMTGDHDEQMLANSNGRDLGRSIREILL